MNSSMAVARREFRTFFASPIAYIVLGGFLLRITTLLASEGIAHYRVALGR